MTTYETALFLVAGIVSGIFPFILSAYSGGSRTIIFRLSQARWPPLRIAGLPELLSQTCWLYLPSPTGRLVCSAIYFW